MGAREPLPPIRKATGVTTLRGLSSFRVSVAYTESGTVRGPDQWMVHVKYGFGGLRRLDLEAGTNSDGQVTFAGRPARVHRPPLEFH
jgi:hypothetical protein